LDPAGQSIGFAHDGQAVLLVDRTEAAGLMIDWSAVLSPLILPLRLTLFA
jgi:hypothetical protein